MSTEEQNHSPAALTDAALKAALAAAAGIPARPVEDISTGYEPVVAEGASPLAGFAEAAGNLGFFEWAQPPASIPLTLVSNRDDEEMKALEERRQTAISALKDAIAKAEGEERDDLKQALERLESAKNPGEIQAALTVAQSTLSREAAGSSSKSAGGEMAEINARHREMYANDPEYRAAVDRFVEKSEMRLSQSESREQQLDRLAQQLGIETPGADGAVEDARRALERAKNGSPQDRAEAERRYHEALEARNQERERLAREKGEHGAAGQFGSGARQNRSDMDKAMDDLRTWQEEFIKAQRRQMEQQGRSEEEIRELLRAQQRDFDRLNAALLNGGDAQEAREQVDSRRERTEKLQQETHTADATRPSTEPPAPGQNTSATNGTGGAGQTVAAPRPAGAETVGENNADLAAASLPDISSVSNLTNVSLAENQTPARTPAVATTTTQGRGTPSA